MCLSTPGASLPEISHLLLLLVCSERHLHGGRILVSGEGAA